MSIGNKFKVIPGIIAFLSFLGFLDATYLTIEHYKNAIPPCSITNGCEKVLTSQFATIGILPLSLLGVIYFLIILVLSVILFQNFSKKVVRILSFFAISGGLVSLSLFLIQLSIIGAFCAYCLASEAIILLILTFSLYLLRFKYE